MPSHGHSGTPQPPRKQRRDKYIPKACQACRFRKIKCSGHDTCLNCVDRGTECVYDSEPRRRRSKLVKRQDNDARSDGAESQAGGHASPYQSMYTMPERMSPVEEGHVDGLGQTLDGVNGRSAQHSLPDSPSVASLYPQTSAISTTPSRIALSASHGGLTSPATGSYVLHVPASTERLRLHRQYFGSFHAAYPFLDAADMEMRLSHTLDRLGYSNTIDTSTAMFIDSEASTFMAMVCTTWALAQNTPGMTPTMKNAKSTESQFGQAMYTASRSLLQAFEGIHPPSLDTVRCHVLHSIYALHADMVDIALQSHALATRIMTTVYSTHRNRGDRQESESAGLRLWWIIFIIDRTLSRICDVPYLLHIHHLPDQLRRDLGSLKWQRQMCDKTSPILPSLALEGNKNKDTTDDMDDLYLRVLGYICHLWSSFVDEIHSVPPGDQRCFLRESMLLDAELQVLDAILPSTLQWEILGFREAGVPGNASDTCRRLSIRLATSGLRLLLRDRSLTKCACVGKSKPQDGLNIARDTVQNIATFKSKHNTVSDLLSGIAITTTTTLVQSISLLIDILKDEPDDHESENLSSTIEEGYAVLLALAPSCRFTNSAILSLDKKLFPSDDEADDLIPGSRSTPSPAPTGQFIDGGSQRLTAAVDKAALGRSVETKKWDSLLLGLQVGYSDLDKLPVTESTEVV